MLSHSPLQRILAHESAYWTCISAVEEQNGWRAFHNRTLAPRIDPNHAGEFRGRPGEGVRIVREVIDFYTTLGVTPAAYVDCLSTPADLIPALLDGGFEEWSGAENDLMLYVGPDEANAAAARATLVTTATERAAWASIMEPSDERTRQLLHQLYTREIEDARMRGYLICVDGEPACRCELFSWNGLGRVEAVRTDDRYQRRGLAAAAIRQAVTDSLLLGNQLTYIYAEPGGNAQRLYHRLGFRTVTHHVTRSFVWGG